jgi:NADH-quinone oxidoreductase subunit J
MNLFQEIVFWALAGLAVAGSLGAVSVRSIFHAGLLMVVSFLGVAGIFALAGAAFLAVVQVLVYAGGVAVLVIFAVMLTRDVPTSSRSGPLGPAAALIGAVLFALLAYAVTQAQWALLPETLPGPVARVFVDAPSRLGQVLVIDHLLAFEVMGVLLLAVVVGALALVRERSDA